MVETILRTKLYIPPLRPDYVSRSHLVERLDRGLRLDHKLSLITAPAGYGKTTLVNEWIHHSRWAGEHEKLVRVAWLSLDESLDDPIQFLRYATTALGTVVAGVEDRVLEMLRATPSPSMEAILTPALNKITDLGNNGVPIIFVLDDYHVISSQAVHDITKFLVQHVPPQLHLVIIGRSDPPWSLARLRASSQFTEINGRDLMFTPEETVQFLDTVMGLKLSAAEQAILQERTEGWIGGLQLAALSMQGLDGRQREALVSTLAATNRYIVDYLTEEVLERRPAGTRDFLLQTSILDQMCGPLCDAVMGIGDLGSGIEDWQSTAGGRVSGIREQGAGSATHSQAILERLEQANLFIVPLDGNNQWYRYHDLFAELLRDRLRQTSPSLVPQLHHRASAWYEAHGMMGSAVEHGLAAGDYREAAELIDRIIDETLMSGAIFSLLAWLDALPPAVIYQRPRLNVYHAIVLLLVGRPQEEVEKRLYQVKEADAAGILSGELYLLQALLATLSGDDKRGYALSHQALEHISEENRFLRGLIFRNLGGVFKMTGDVGAALWAIEEGARFAQKTGDRLGLMATTYQKAEMLALRGELRQSMEMCQRVFAFSAEESDQASPLAVKSLVLMGDIYREWNALDEAEKRLAQAIELADRWIDLWALGAYLILARIRQAQGRIDDVHEALHVAERMAIAYDVSEVDDLYVAAQKARLSLAQGHLDGAQRWALDRHLVSTPGFQSMQDEDVDTETPYQLREFELTTVARLFLAHEQPREALAVLAPLSLAAEELGRTASLIEIGALQALAHHCMDELDRAAGLLRRVLALAEPGGYIRLFVDMGRPLKELLGYVAGKDGITSYTSQILQALGDKPGTRPAAPRQPLHEPLSDREMEVLRLLTTHMSTTEIAGELTISVNTVRFHVKNIYGKLGVHNRSAAVEQARTLALL